MRLYREMSHEEWEATEPVDFLYDESSGTIVVPVPGWWAQWCVTHDSSLLRLWRARRRCVRRQSLGIHRICVWHPQGAFIPDTEKGD